MRQISAKFIDHYIKFKAIKVTRVWNMEPILPFSRNVVHACGFTPGFKVIMTMIDVDDFEMMHKACSNLVGYGGALPP